MRLPLIINVWRSGLKCTAMVVSASHLYEWRATPCWEPNASKGGGGTEGAGLFRKRLFGGGRRPSLILSSAMPCRTFRLRGIQGGWGVPSKNAEVVAPLIGVQLVSSWR